MTILSRTAVFILLAFNSELLLANTLTNEEFHVGIKRIEFGNDNYEPLENITLGGFVWPTYEQTSPLEWDSLVSGGVATQTAKNGATAFVISNGITKLCLVSLDVLSIKKEDVEVIISQLPAEGIDCSEILVSATHTHTSNKSMSLHGADKDEEFITHLISVTIEALKGANAAASATAPNSKHKIYFKNIKFDPTANSRHGNPILDTDLPLLVFENINLGTRHLLYSFAAHGNLVHRFGSLGPQVYGLVLRELEAESPLKYAAGGFIPGCAGGQYYTYNEDSGTHSDNDSLSIEQYLDDTASNAPPLLTSNEVLVDELKATILGELENEDGSPADLGTPLNSTILSSTKQTLYYDYRETLPLQKQTYVNHAFDDHPDHWEHRRWLRNSVSLIENQRNSGLLGETPIQTISIGDLTIYTMGGEIYPEVGLAIKAQRPNQKTMVFSLSNDYVGYTPANQYIYDYQSQASDHGDSAYATPNQMLAAFGFSSIDLNNFDKMPIKVETIGSPYSAWYTDWKGIVPLFKGEETFLLFWGSPSLPAGNAYLYKIDENTGNAELMNDYAGWSTSWDQIIPIDYVEDNNLKHSLLFWDKDYSNTNSVAYLFDVFGNTNFDLTHKQSYTWAKWTGIQPLYQDGVPNPSLDRNSTDLLFYDSTANNKRALRGNISRDAPHDLQLQMFKNKPLVVGGEPVMSYFIDSTSDPEWDFQDPNDYFNTRSIIKWRWYEEDDSSTSSWRENNLNYFLLRAVQEKNVQVADFVNTDNSTFNFENDAEVIMLQKSALIWNKSGTPIILKKFSRIE